eukprot:213366_1
MAANNGNNHKYDIHEKKSDYLSTTHIFNSAKMNEEDANVFTPAPLPENTNQNGFDSDSEKILNVVEGDKRVRCDNNILSSIVLIRSRYIFPNNRSRTSIGTGCVFHVNYESNKVYILTCAHVVCSTDPTNNNEPIYPTYIWFEKRKTHKNGGSELMQRFPIESAEVYPAYFQNPQNTVSYSGYDLAICVANLSENSIDTYFKLVDLFKPMLVDSFDRNGGYNIFGFPGDDKEGELWGMFSYVKNAQYIERQNELIRYSNIDTTGGQSGAPIYFSIYGTVCIIGVHTGGRVEIGKNWGTRLTKDKLEWIGQMICGNNYSVNINHIEQKLRNKIDCALVLL